MAAWEATCGPEWGRGHSYRPGADPSAGQEAGPVTPREASRLEARRYLEALVRSEKGLSQAMVWGRQCQDR